MADEKEPHLEPSDHEAPTEADRVVSDESDTTEYHAQDSEPADSAAPNAAGGEANDDDAETRMLQQIAALNDEKPADDDAESSQQTESTEVVDDALIAAAAQQPTQPAPEPLEHETEQTKMFSPIAPAAGSAGTGDGTGDKTKTPRKKRRWPWVLVSAVVLLGAGYIGTAFATENTLPATLTVEGVDVSGLSVEDAAPVLDQELAGRAERELSVTAAEVEASMVPAESGYNYDVEATLNGLTELTFNPVEIWGRLFGEAHVSAVTTIDDAAADEAVAGLSEQLTYDPTEGSVVFEGDTLDYSAPVDGFTTDQQQLAEQLRTNWLSEEAEMSAPGDAQAPTVSEDQWDQFVADTAQPLVDAAYAVTAGDATTELTPAQLGAAAEVRVEEGEEGDAPVLALDGEALAESLAENNVDFESTNQDASIELTGSAGSASPEVVPGSPGRGVDSEQVVDEILADLDGEQTRSITVDLHEVEPSVTTEEAEAWDVNHVVADYATPYPADAPRTANLRVGAERVNGTVVMPGEEFNLNALLAPITAANGYHSSGVVESGVTTNAMGGGLSQISTMSYNAGFLSGMEIIEHKPHSRWFDRYPQGRESTYWEGQINVRWKNDTDAPVILEMWLADSQVHSRLWGSDYYEVSTSTSEPYNYTQSPTIHSSGEECIPESGGQRGFTVDVHRSKTPPGTSTVQESWSWAYSGWPTVICD